ncbi:MAG TPA: hypothetical protein ENL23_01050, partial [Candidatus Acetothermia bacterium]|nr:hypothetical protein [Candidatus Acetothermia bacterium]
GDLMPPTALAGLFAAKVVKQDNYTKVLRQCLLPALLTVGVSLGYIATADFWEKIIFRSNSLVLYGVLLGIVIAAVAGIMIVDRIGGGRRPKEEICP